MELLDTTVTVSNEAPALVQLTDSISTVFSLGYIMIHRRFPPPCRCQREVSEEVGQAEAPGVTVPSAGTPSSAPAGSAGTPLLKSPMQQLCGDGRPCHRMTPDGNNLCFLIVEGHSCCNSLATFSSRAQHNELRLFSKKMNAF